MPLEAACNEERGSITALGLGRRADPSLPPAFASPSSQGWEEKGFLCGCVGIPGDRAQGSSAGSVSTGSGQIKRNRAQQVRPPMSHLSPRMPCSQARDFKGFSTSWCAFSAGMERNRWAGIARVPGGAGRAAGKRWKDPGIPSHPSDPKRQRPSEAGSPKRPRRHGSHTKQPVQGFAALSKQGSSGPKVHKWRVWCLPHRSPLGLRQPRTPGRGQSRRGNRDTQSARARHPARTEAPPYGGPPRTEAGSPAPPQRGRSGLSRRRLPPRPLRGAALAALSALSLSPAPRLRWRGGMLPAAGGPPRSPAPPALPGWP